MAAMLEDPSVCSRGRLLKLELQDFKSYRGRQIIGPFPDDFVSIIGPNGAGKSNLMDALCFVLGLQSTHLRSSHLVELIHRGPGAKPSFAQVEAHYQIKNSEIVIFSRRVTSSGSSEYRINNVTTPFTNYVQAWEAQNVLIKARNFLVFQGDVEAVATRSPKDLTRLLETISGSEEIREEYDRTKMELEAALEDSASGFSRKRGVAAELKAIQDQRADGKRYSQLMDKLCQEKVILNLAKLFNADQESKVIIQTLPQDDSLLSALEQNVSVAESAWKDAKKKASTLHKQLTEKEKHNRATLEHLDRELPSLLALEEGCVLVESKIATIKENISKTSHDQLCVSAELKKLQDSHKNTLQSLDDFEIEAKKIESRSEAARKNTKLVTEYQALKLDADQATAKEHLKKQSIDRRLNPSRATRSVLYERIEEIKRTQLRVQRDHDGFKTQFETLERDLSHHSKEYAKICDEIEVSEALRRKNEELIAENTECLREVVEQLLGAGGAAVESQKEIRRRTAVEALKRIFPGRIHGRLVELVRPISKRYESAVSVVLGTHMDSVVVQDERTAIAAVRALREQRHSVHMTFLPLDTIGSSGSRNQKSIQPPAGTRWAKDVLRYESAYEAAVNYATAHSVVCDSLKEAIKHAFEAQGVRKAVSLDGCVISRKGLMTGGSFSDAAGAVNRWEATDIADLKRRRDSLLDTIKSASQALRRTEIDERKRLRIIELESMINNCKKAQSTLERRASSLLDEQNHLKSELNRCQSKCESVEAEISKGERETEEIAKKIDEKRLIIMKHFLEREGFDRESDLALDTDEISKLAEKRASIHAILSKMGQQIDYCNTVFSDYSKRLDELETRRLELEDENHESSLVQIKNSLDKQTEFISDLRNKRSKALDAYESIKNLAQQASREQQNARESLSEHQDSLQSASRKLTAGKCDLDRLQSMRLGLLKRCRLEEIHIPLTDGRSIIDCQDLSNVEIDYTLYNSLRKKNKVVDLEQSIHEIEQELEMLMPNIRAPEKIDGSEERLKENLNAFEQTRERLRLAKESFAIAKGKRTKRFQIALEHVINNIDGIYKELTRSDVVPTGGSAFVTAENADEPYLEGIRFHAMPPMKRFLDMEHLSGGERTIAALALLFAIHSFRPAPFFILDEIDAALDAANVQRISAFIQSRSKGIRLTPSASLFPNNKDTQSQPSDSPISQSSLTTVSMNPGSGTTAPVQFLVISLKASLYEKADALIGVMREPSTASSRVLSMRLLDYPTD